MERIYLNNLYDIYQSLLTLKEIKIFQSYYIEDLSLQEIATNEKVSRTAISKTLERTKNKLLKLENNLHIYKDKEDIKKALIDKDYNKIEVIVDNKC